MNEAKGLLDNPIPSLEVPPRRIQRSEVYIKEKSPANTTNPLKWELKTSYCAGLILMQRYGFISIIQYLLNLVHNNNNYHSLLFLSRQHFTEL